MGITGGGLAAAVDLNHPAHVIHWGFVQITLANLIVILVMIALFVAAIVLPFPPGRRDR